MEASAARKRWVKVTRERQRTTLPITQKFKTMSNIFCLNSSQCQVPKHAKYFDGVRFIPLRTSSGPGSRGDPVLSALAEPSIRAG